MKKVHDDLCPRQLGFWRRCICDLILDVRSNQRRIDKPDNAFIVETARKWYYSGVQDSAESIEELCHESPCDCESCKTLTIAYRQVLGIKP